MNYTIVLVKLYESVFKVNKPVVEGLMATIVLVLEQIKDRFT
jgi:hypothetical protein